MIDKIKKYINDNEFKLILFLNCVYITNYDQILTLDNDRISLSVSNRLIVIKGNNLVLSRLLEKEILISGEIFNIEELYD